MSAVCEVLMKTGHSLLGNCFYWLAVAATLAAVSLVLLGNTKLVYPFEHTNFPLAWKFAGVAVLAYLAREIFSPAFQARRDEERASRNLLKHIPHEL